MHRVYFNRKSEAPQVWSVDQGTQETEINVAHVCIGPNVVVVSVYDGTPSNPDTPCAWFECQDSVLELLDGIAYLNKK